MARSTAAVLALVAGLSIASPAFADPPAAASAALPPATASNGLAVVALAGAADSAWPLAQAVYANAALRPSSLDEAHARVLAGERPTADAPRDLRDLADTVAAVKGDDAPSRQLLSSVALTFHARGVVVVSPGATPNARVFLADTSAFDAASYAPDPAPPSTTGAPAAPTWHAAVQSLARAYAPAPAPVPASTAAPPTSSAKLSAPPLAVHEGPRIDNAPPASRPFYASGWFWGAIGAAAFAGGAIYFATKDNGSSSIHLQVQVPR
jgi:hypothetical protein